MLIYFSYDQGRGAGQKEGGQCDLVLLLIALYNFTKETFFFFPFNKLSFILNTDIELGQ